MNKGEKRLLACVALGTMFFLPALSLADSFTVADGATTLAEAGSNANPAEWTIDHDYTTAADPFSIGADGQGYNHLTVDGTHSFSAENDVINGPIHSSSNQLNVIGGGQFSVGGTLYNGMGSIWYYSQHNEITVSGPGSLLDITGNLDMSAGYNATDNVITLADGGITKVDGSFDLYYHWCYGNNWLELNGGELWLKGDKTADFEASDGVLSSIKVWDAGTDSFQRVAYYSSTTFHVNQPYLDMLSVTYNAQTGYTVISNVNPVPEPATLFLFGTGIAGLLGRRLRRKTVFH